MQLDEITYKIIGASMKVQHQVNPKIK